MRFCATFSSATSREDLVPWMISLQRFADRVDPGFNRHFISKALLEMILYADMLKSCDTLKKVILEGCRLSLPSEVYDGIESYVKLLPLPDKSTVSRFCLSLEAAWLIRHWVLNWHTAESRSKFVRFLILEKML